MSLPQIDNYTILRPLGEGRLGTVYLARRGNERFAIKVIHDHLTVTPNFIDRFKQYVEQAKGLTSPHIVPIREYTAEMGASGTYIVYDYVELGSLQKRLTARLRLRGAAHVAQQVLQAVATGHKQGLQHLGITTTNILVTHMSGEQFGVTLTDFGLMQLANDMSFRFEPPPETLAYLAPEQLLQQRVDERTDLYAIGTLFYYMVTAQLPVRPPTLANARTMAQNPQPIRPISQFIPIQPGVEQVVVNEFMRCLNPDPNNRPQRANDLLRVLRELNPRPSEAVPRHSVQPASSGVVAPIQSTYEPLALAEIYYEMRGRTETRRQFVMTRDVIRIGRNYDQDLRLEGPGISRAHVQVSRSTNGQFYVKDLRTTNGTLLGGRRLPPVTDQLWQAATLLEQGALQGGQKLQVGDFDLYIVPVVQQQSVSQPVPPPPPSAAVPTANLAPSVSVPPSEHYEDIFNSGGFFDVSLTKKEATITPGEREEIYANITSKHNDTLPLSVSVQGLQPEWYSIVPQQVEMDGNGSRRSIQIRIEPSIERGDIPPAGKRTIAVDVNINQMLGDANVAANQQRFVRRAINLTINPFYRFHSDVNPKRAQAGEAIYAEIHNQGNVTDRYDIRAEATERIAVRPQHTPVEVRAGETARVPLVVNQQQQFLSRNRPTPLNVTVTSLNGQSPLQATNATFLTGAALPTWVFGVAALALTMCLLSTILGTAAAILSSNSPTEVAGNSPEDVLDVTVTSNENITRTDLQNTLIAAEAQQQNRIEARDGTAAAQSANEEATAGAQSATNEAAQTQVANLTGTETQAANEAATAGAPTPTPQPAQISINDPAPITEGNGANNRLIFTITLDRPLPGDTAVTVAYEISPDSANAGTDYIDSSGTVTINPGESSDTFSVEIVSDNERENPSRETFFVDISIDEPEAPAAIAKSRAVGSIDDDDGNVTTLQIGDASVTECSGGDSVPMMFPVIISPPLPDGFIFMATVSAVDGTATSGDDFTLVTTNLSNPPTDITVNIQCDSDNEPDETFFVQVSDVTGSVIVTDGEAMGTIVDDDSIVITVQIGDAFVTECSDVDPTPISFPIVASSTLPDDLVATITVDGGTATSGVDYDPASLMLTATEITVDILCDDENEPDETFFVRVSEVVGDVVIVDGEAMGTIIDDDGNVTTLQIGDASVTECSPSDGMTMPMTFPVLLSPPLPAGVAFMATVSAVDGTATSGDDFTLVTTNLSNPPTDITVNIQCDGNDEPDETFFIQISDVTGNVVLVNGQGTGTIIDDDIPQVTYNISGPTPFSISEDNTDNIIVFTVTLTGANANRNTDISIDYMTRMVNALELSPGGIAEQQGCVATATQNTDYVEQSGTLIFNPGTASNTVSVPINDDAIDEPLECFIVQLTGDAFDTSDIMLTAGDIIGIAGIADDDP